METVASIPSDIDLILMDIDLGRGMDGTETARKILGRHDIPIVFLSSHIEPEVVEKTETITSYGYVVKNSGSIVLDASIKMAFKLHAAHKAIESSNALLQGVLERVRDGFVAFDADFNYTYVNPYGAELLGRSAEDLIGKNYWTEYPEASATAFAEAYVRAMETQQPVVLEDYYEHWDRWFVNRIYPSKEGLTIFFGDITERKRADQKMRHLNRELQAISQCNQILIRAVDESALLDDICRVVCREAGYPLAWVGFAEHDAAKTIRPVAWGGKDDGYVATLDVTWADEERGHGPTGTAIRSGKSTSVDDFRTDPSISLWREKALRRGYRSNIALPLADSGGAVFGALTIYSDKPDAFPPAERRLLEELAGNLAYGVMVLRGRERNGR